MTKAGTITQVRGAVTFLPFAPPSKIQNVQEKANLQTGGSYLTREDAFFTAQLFDGSWLRIGPDSKFALDHDQKNKTITVHLFTGSIKAIISTELNQGKIQKIYIKGNEGTIEAQEAKFTVVRNSLIKTFSVYVEKGTVTVAKAESIQHVHALETITLEEKSPGPPAPRKIGKKEMKFLQGTSYLDRKNKNEI